MALLKHRLAALCAAAFLASFGQAWSADTEYFKIVVVDAETGRGIPLAELETVSRMR